MKNTHRWGVTALTLMALTASAAGLSQDLFAAMRKKYSGRQPGLDAMSSTPDKHGLEWEAFAVENPDGVRIASWWLPAEGAQATVVMVHGFNMNKSQMLTRARFLVNAGVHVALVDLRARGESGGDMTSPGPDAASDVTAVLEHIRVELAPSLPVVLYGFSHGARTVLFTAQQDGEHAQAPLVGVIAEAPPFSLRAAFKRQMKSSFAPPIPEGDLVATCTELSDKAVLILVGADDPDLSAEEARRLVPGKETRLRRVEIFADTGHGVLTPETEALFGDTVTVFVASLLER
ncbi:MAG: pimeloyl-ACP methyl ester carboxylesterase [Chlamydiales bacterium]|jgi:pimeloyl-ACP methyl ester carboxylesterase